MAEEKQTENIDDTLCAEDMEALREVLEDNHNRGMTPVSTYNPSQIYE